MQFEVHDEDSVDQGSSNIMGPGLVPEMNEEESNIAPESLARVGAVAGNVSDVGVTALPMGASVSSGMDEQEQIITPDLADKTKCSNAPTCSVFNSLNLCDFSKAQHFLICFFFFKWFSSKDSGCLIVSARHVSTVNRPSRCSGAATTVAYAAK